MTEQALPLPGGAPGAAPAAPRSSSTTSRATAIAAAVGVDAITAWASGTASWHGWGIALPFMATWLGLIAVTVLVSTLAFIVANHWHGQAAEWASAVATKAIVAEHVAAAYFESPAGQAAKARLAQLL